ncbi:MAG: GvpL/GvpF family gas vesicle protein [Thermodesulfobacteriota bacterium]
MAGLYLYCLRENAQGPLLTSTRGIDGKGEVFALPFRELEAVVSEVSLEEFGCEEVQKRAQEDVNWIKEKALTHARVIQEAMKKDHIGLSLIPMRFGIIFNDVEGLEKALEKDYFKIREILERIRGKQEWSVKAYLKDRKAFEERIKEKNEVIKEKEKELAFLSEGMSYFLEEELKEIISKEVDKELNNVMAYLFESLKKQAIDSVRCKILGRELTGRIEPMVLNAACLLQEEKIEDFKKEIEELNDEIRIKGLYIEYSGPWPAYNFTSWQSYDEQT